MRKEHDRRHSYVASRVNYNNKNSGYLVNIRRIVKNSEVSFYSLIWSSDHNLPTHGRDKLYMSKCGMYVVSCIC